MWFNSEYSKGEFYFDNSWSVTYKATNKHVFSCAKYNYLIDLDESYYLNPYSGLVCGVGIDDFED